MANSTLCPAHSDQLRQAQAALQRATWHAAERPSATLVERYNDACSWVTATMHECWSCAECTGASQADAELPLFAQCQ